MEEREKLIKKLIDMSYEGGCDAIADFILEDRKRALKTLISLGDMSFNSLQGLKSAIKKTIKNAGVYEK